MRIVDSRRLRGRNLQTAGAAAVAEVALEGETAEGAVEVWRRELRRVCEALGWEAKGVAREFSGGVCFAIEAPIDVLMAATEVNEWAIESAAAVMAGEGALDVNEAAERIRGEIALQERPALRALAAEAARREVPFLWDDELVTIGLAKRSRTFAIDAIPEVVDWEGVGSVPLALVTGTNGKTTSVRLLARMAREAGFRAGYTSSDGIVVGDELVEAGDWTGGEAARALLRRHDVELAVVETARGGVLRRGVAVDRADVALLTNVSRDHFGEYGVHDVATMARVKAVVGHAVRAGGRVVLNADDPYLAGLLGTFAAEVTPFSLSRHAVASYLDRGGEAWYAEAGALWRETRGVRTRIGAIDEMPLTFGGHARHNVQNCLGAAATARALGLPDAAVLRALEGFGSLVEDNPGRGRVASLASGVKVIADFAHNPDGIRALLVLAQTVRESGRLAFVVTVAGDRSDDDIAAIAIEIARARPAQVVAWDAPVTLRGRAAGEVPFLLARELSAVGVPTSIATSEVAAVEAALAWARPDDLVIVAPNIDRAGVAALLD